MAERAKASKLAYIPVTSFVQNVASRAPVPGGGSVAALSGSLGAALQVMVCRISAGRMGEAERPFFEELEKRAMEWRDRLRDLVDEDAEAYDRVIEANKSGDAAAQAEANRRAAEVPLETARVARQAMDTLKDLAQRCYPGAMTDVAVAAGMLAAAVSGARFNVLVNLPAVGDEAFVARARCEVDTWLGEALEIESHVVRRVEERLLEAAGD